MTQHINDGGPAFPVQEASTYQGHGMSLLDYFAAVALQGALAYPGIKLSRGPAEYAELAYKMADAMLAERKKRELA